MNNNTEYDHTFSCACGKTITIKLSSRYSYNVGEAIDKSGWVCGSCEYTSNAVWMCPKCGTRAKELAKELFHLTRTPYYYYPALIDNEIRTEWCEKQIKH